MKRKIVIPISAVVIAVISSCYQAVYAQNIFNSENENITIYISPLDSSMYSNKAFLLSGANYYVQFEQWISHKIKLISINENLSGIKENAKLNLGNLLEVDILNPHKHNSQELSFYEKFIIKCLLLVTFNLNNGITK